MEMGVDADGRPQGPHPHIHILSRPYYTRLGLAFKSALAVTDYTSHCRARQTSVFRPIF